MQEKRTHTQSYPLAFHSPLKHRQDLSHFLTCGITLSVPIACSESEPLAGMSLSAWRCSLLRNLQDLHASLLGVSVHIGPRETFLTLLLVPFFTVRVASSIIFIQVYFGLGPTL